MTSVLIVAAGYVAIAAKFGWAGVAMIGIHIVIMLAATNLAKRKV